MAAAASRRVVITGLGLICPIGSNVKNAWANILSGKTGVKKLKEEYSQLPCSVAAFIDHSSSSFNLENLVSKSEQRKISKSVLYAIGAATEALQDAEWLPNEEEELLRTGVSVGMGMSDLGIITNTHELLVNGGYNKISPHFIPSMLPNMAAGHISLKYGFRGPNHTVSTACATGLHSIGDSYLMIKAGYADVMVCGGTDAAITPLSIAGFCRIKALCTNFNDEPLKASRPFDKERDGFVMSEGAGIVVLEEWNHAIQRGVKAYAEILGYGMSSDASHVTAPRSDGKGIIQCMMTALSNASISKQEVSYVNAHATSTPLGDIAESKAIHNLFGKIFVSSNKGNTGHMLGGSGGAETIFTAMSCYSGILPHTANLLEVDNAFPPLFYIKNQPIEWPVSKCRIAMCNSFGFGGTNASLCIASV